MTDGGKGSVQRPIANRKIFEENWDAIFNGGGNRSNTNDNNVRGRQTEGVGTGQETSPEHEPSERRT